MWRNRAAGVDVEYGLALTTHMPMPMRFDVLRATAEIRIDDLDALDELDDRIADYGQAVAKRNAVAHDRWGIDLETGELVVARHTARGTVKADLKPTTVEQVVADAQFIYEVGMKLFSFMKRLNIVPPVIDRPSRYQKSKAARQKRRQQK